MLLDADNVTHVQELLQVIKIRPDPFYIKCSDFYLLDLLWSGGFARLGCPKKGNLFWVREACIAVISAPRGGVSAQVGVSTSGPS